MAAGSLFTTAEDYARFLTFLLRREGLLASMLEPQTKVTDSLEWGLGWGLSSGYAFYWGDNLGFKHLAVLHPAEGSGLVVLTNSDSGWRLHLGLADLAFPSASFVTWLTELYG